MARGVTLVHRDGPDSEAGYDLLAKGRAMALAHQIALAWVPFVDTHTATRKAQRADVDGAIERSRAAVDNLVASGDLSTAGWQPTLWSNPCCSAVPRVTSPKRKPRSTC